MSKKDVFTEGIPLNDIYQDLAAPSVKVVGELAAYIPRVVRILLQPFQLWINEREKRFEEIVQLMSKKLKDTPSENIKAPESYIAIPVFQAISYSLDNEVLKDAFANLLAASMIVNSNAFVHPAYVEVLKQMTPDEAKILSVLRENQAGYPCGRPGIIVSDNPTTGHVETNKYICFVAEDAGCEFPHNTSIYLDNLERLGIVKVTFKRHLTDNSMYEKIKTHSFNIVPQIFPPHKVTLRKGVVILTEFGRDFADLCISDMR